MILRRYIARRLVLGWLLALAVLAPVFGVISFIQELERTQLDYDALAVARYSLMTLPQQMLTLAPVIALLGTMAALSGLYRSHELTVMSCAGYPRSQLVEAILRPTILLMLLLWLAMETAVPSLQLAAEEQRHNLRYGNQVKISEGGIWAIDGRRYTRLGRITRGGEPGDIDIFEFDEDGQLLSAVHGRTASVLPKRRWLLHGVREKRLVDGDLVTRRRKEMTVENLWAQDELPTLSLPLETMRLSVLHGYADYLEQSGRPAQRYVSLFWEKLLMPLKVLAMVLLATPLSANSGSGRERSVGVKLGIGALVGILFFLVAQIIHALGQLLGLVPAVTALLPSVLVFICALMLLQRLRW
ncbi:LPS export ABC transporter permease LptG [Mangrovimicrobium sediminis]|uniref:LPS export ABC transporter permease LptG n=1 Tax=Mangrovimicrobium sediminis TaxID=2562682 RepID=A0A4Z0LWS3_9GAMM|nr:LPS export ABC transporter permease LptG [Haliea sp. SAOS-164]TGD71597.1 LPS export ABC transporter permease LptG [Haliea sp. SAOS-164]